MATESLNLNALTVGEMKAFEKVVEKGAYEYEGKPLDVTAISALVWIVEKRTNPAYTMDEVDALDQDEFQTKVIDLAEKLAPPTKGESPKK